MGKDGKKMETERIVDAYFEMRWVFGRSGVS